MKQKLQIQNHIEDKIREFYPNSSIPYSEALNQLASSMYLNESEEYVVNVAELKGSFGPFEGGMLIATNARLFFLGNSLGGSIAGRYNVKYEEISSIEHTSKLLSRYSGTITVERKKNKDELDELFVGQREGKFENLDSKRSHDLAEYVKTRISKERAEQPRISIGPIADVLVFAEPRQEWMRSLSMNVFAPDTLISQADQALGLQGALITFMSKKFIQGKIVSHMTDTEIGKYVEKQPGSKRWVCYNANTDDFKYYLVVIFL
jgi:hypothetical protein